MAVSQLQYPHVRTSGPVPARRATRFQSSAALAPQRSSFLSSRHSPFCASNTSAFRARSSTVSSRCRKGRQHSVASLWFRTGQAPGSAAASAVAAHAATILSTPLWQHAAQSACVVVATLALAVTVSKFLIINSGKLEAGEVCLAFLPAAAEQPSPEMRKPCVCFIATASQSEDLQYTDSSSQFPSLPVCFCRRSHGWRLWTTRRSSPASPGCATHWSLLS